jgi:hypothetical protein
MEILNYLDTQLPPESHVVLMGLIDGSVLYKAMAKRFHPLGELRGDLVSFLLIKLGRMSLGYVLLG